ncbi:MAG: hypothetical protein ACJAUP_000902 [Cellvibrionaceae bacterium]|jgi:hypothetical protein
MKPDVLTITAIVFVIGVFVSSIGITDGLTEKRDVPPSALHIGIAVR